MAGAFFVRGVPGDRPHRRIARLARQHTRSSGLPGPSLPVFHRAQPGPSSEVHQAFEQGDHMNDTPVGLGVLLEALTDTRNYELRWDLAKGELAPTPRAPAGTSTAQ